MYCIANNYQFVRIIDFDNNSKTYLVENAFDFNKLDIYKYDKLFIYHNTNTLTREVEEQLIGKELFQLII